METIVLHILKLRYVVLASMRIKVLYKVQIYHGAYHADYYYKDYKDYKDSFHYNISLHDLWVN